MPSNRLAPIDALFNQSRDAIAKEWIDDVLREWGRKYPDLVSDDDVRR